MSASDEVPSGVVKMDDYVSESGPVPVQKDDAPVKTLDPAKADTDEQLRMSLLEHRSRFELAGSSTMR